MTDLIASHTPVRPEDERKARRKLEDQRRMQFRRAIETYAEQRRLQAEMADYPDLIAVDYLAALSQVRYLGLTSR